MNSSTQQPGSPERRRFDNGSANVAHREFGHTKSPLSQWVAVYAIIAASILGAFSIIVGKWWMAWLAIAITVAATLYAVLTTRAIARGKAAAGTDQTMADRENAPA